VRGKYLEIPRTEGISTTDIVGRMLLMTRSHHSSTTGRGKAAGGRRLSGCISGAESGDEEEGSSKLQSIGNLNTEFTDESRGEDEDACDQWDDISPRSHFLATSSIMKLFGAGVKPPSLGDKVVYVTGSFDMYNAGHVQLLAKAKAMGDYLIVGIYNDDVVNSYSGSNLPILNQNERVLSVLGCSFVNDVLISAPPSITAEMMSTLDIAVVVRPKHEVMVPGSHRVPEQMGKLVELDLDTQISVSDLIVRINNQVCGCTYTSDYTLEEDQSQSSRQIP
jgi:ethanolamine-phosphate cytidylyltransferase